MFERKNKNKPTRPTCPPKPTSSYFTFLPALHRIKASRSLNEFRRGSLLTFDYGLHVTLLPQSTRLLPINELKGITWHVAFIWMGVGCMFLGIVAPHRIILKKEPN